MITTLLHPLRLFPFLCGRHRQLALENLALHQQLARPGPENGRSSQLEPKPRYSVRREDEPEASCAGDRRTASTTWYPTPNETDGPFASRSQAMHSPISLTLTTTSTWLPGP